MSERNVVVSIVGRIVSMLTSFVGRSVFVSVLSAQYLGLGGFFGNIFAVISLCELGVGTAIAQSLYKPLSKNDEYEIAAVMRYFSKIYSAIALVTLCLSLCAIPILPQVVKSEIDYNIVLMSYILFTTHAFFSYILAPKRCLVVCDQRMYVVTAVRSIFSVVALVIQCVVLAVTKNYVLYLVCRIFVLTLEDIAICYYADKRYPFLSMKLPVSKQYKKSLFTNVKALMWHKVGGTLSRSTDSILISYFVGLSCMGKYSNYALVIGTIVAFFDVAVNAVSASVGNLGAGDRGNKSEKVMRRLYFINFWLLTVGTSIIVSILNPFIELWLGSDMLFSDFEMLVVVSSFYFSCIRDPVQIFVSSFGLFKESRFLPMLRAAVNLVLSILFVRNMGISGVFLGTTLSTILVPLCGEVGVLYKYGFSMKPGAFYKEMLSYIGVSLLCSSLCFVLTYNIRITLVGVVVRCVSAFCASNALLLIFCSHSEYFDDMIRILKKVKLKKK